MRSIVSAPMARSLPRSGTQMRLPCVGPLEPWWTRGSSNWSSMHTGSLCSTTHTASSTWSGDHGRILARLLVDQLDQDVVRPDQFAEPIDDRAQQHRRLEHGEDRLGDA